MRPLLRTSIASHVFPPVASSFASVPSRPPPVVLSSPSVGSSVVIVPFFSDEREGDNKRGTTEHAQGGQEGEPSREDLHRVRSAVHVAQKVGEVVGRDHDVQQELQSEEEGRWAPRGGGEDEYDDDDGRLILMAPVVGGVTHDPLKAHRQLELVWAAQRWQLRP